MRIDVEVSEVNIDVPGILSRVQSDRVGRFAAAEWHRLYKQYTPFRKGKLYNRVAIEPWEIHHTVSYAKYQYYGDTFHFFDEHHPHAGSRWDQRAAPIQQPKLERELQALINREVSR